MRSPLSLSDAAARRRLAAVPLCFTGLIVVALAFVAWRHSAHSTVVGCLCALIVAVFAVGLTMAFRNRIGDPLSRVRFDGDALRVEHGADPAGVPLAIVRDVHVRDLFPLEVVSLRLADGSRIAFAFAHRNALTRLRSPSLAHLLARLPDASLRERAPRLGGDIARLPWWARCPELLAIPLGAIIGVAIAALSFVPTMLWPAVFDAPRWWVALLVCGAGVAGGAMVFLAIRTWRTPPDVRLWKGVLLVRCRRNGRLIERCHPLDGVAGVRYSRAFGRHRRVCLFAIELRGVLATRALRITFPAQSSQAVLRTLRWPGSEANE